MNRSFFVFIALILLLLVGCSGSGSEGTWVTDQNSNFGTWLQINEDGTYSRDGFTGEMGSENGTDCLLNREGSECHPVTVDGDVLTVMYFGAMLNFWRINQEAHEQPQPDHPLVGSWVFPESGTVVDFLPNGEMASEIVGQDIKQFWTADSNIICLGSYLEVIEHTTFPTMWKDGGCAPITFDEPYVTLRDGLRDSLILRRNE